MSADFRLLCWLFTVALALHNLEEALFLPAWSRRITRWGRPVGDREFRFAAVVLTILAVVLSGWVSIAGQESVAAYLMAGYAFAMLVNVLFPHLSLTILSWRYMPGLGTALLLILPTTLLILREAISVLVIEALVIVGVLFALALLASLPILFGIGRWLFRHITPSPDAQASGK